MFWCVRESGCVAVAGVLGVFLTAHVGDGTKVTIPCGKTQYMQLFALQY